jgi:thioredoxin 1
MAAYVVATDDNFQEVVLDATLPVLVDFWAPWCGPCQMMGPVIEKVAASLEGKAVVVKYDVQDNQDFAAKYGIQGIPAFKVFKNGEVVDEAVGGMPEEKLTALIEKHL